MSDSDLPCIYCPSCGQDHPWLAYLKGQEFQCACGHVMRMPDEAPSYASQSSTKANVETGTTYSLDALVDSGIRPSSQTNDADDSDTLEVIEDDELEVIEEDEDQATSDENLYELSANDAHQGGLQIPPSSSKSAGNASSGSAFDTLQNNASDDVVTRAAPKPGMTTCPYCNTQYPFRDAFCPECGRDDLGHVHDVSQKKQDTVRMRIMGIPCTPVSMSIVTAVFLLFAYLGYWFITGPAANFRYYDMQVVDASVLMSAAVQRNEGPVLPGFGAIGGVGKGSGSKAGSSTLSDDAGRLAGGYTNQLFAIKPGSNGQKVLLDVAVRQSVLDNNNSRSGYDMVLVSSSFTIRAGDKVIPTMILMEELPNKLNIDIGSGSSSDIKTAFPPQIIPEEIDWDDYNRLPIEGQATFKGSKGLTGNISFYIYALHPDAINARGMTMNGKLSYVTPSGIKANYTYTGGMMNLDVDPACEVWRGVPDEKFKASWSPYHQFRFRLIFDRPASGKYGLYFQDIHMMNIKIP